MLLLPLPPSSAIRASCLVRPRLSEKMLSERRRAIKKQLWAANAASLLAAGGQRRHTGEEACSKTHLQYRHCLGVRARAAIRCCSPQSRCCAGLSFHSHNDPGDIFSPWAHTGSPWESGCLRQLYLRQNKMFLPKEEKKISLKTLMQHLFIYFRNSGVESVFCSKEQVKEMFLVKGIFLSGLLTFLEVH